MNVEKLLSEMQIVSPTLLNLPLEVANQVLEKLGVMDLLTTQKVCRGLRSAVDKLGLPLNSIRFQNWKDEVRMHLNGIEEVKYTPAKPAGTTVAYNGLEKTIPGENFMRIAFKDLEGLLKHAISELSLYNNRGIQENVQFFEEALRTNKPVHIRSLRLYDFSINVIFKLLPYFDAQVLEDLEIFFVKSNNGFEKIRSLEQWKNAKSFTFWSCEFDIKEIEHLFHFEKILITVDKFTVRNAVKIRDDLLKRSTFLECKIYFEGYNSNPMKIAKVFQPDFTEGDNLWSDGSNKFKLHFAVHMFSCCIVN